MLQHYLADPIQKGRVEALAAHLYGKVVGELEPGEAQDIESRIESVEGPMRKALTQIEQAQRLERGEPLAEVLKSAGEGSRGGHVIGHTQSGKPIYTHRSGSYHGAQQALIHHQASPSDWGSASYGATRPATDAEKSQAGQSVRQEFPDYSAQDHEDAAAYHQTSGDMAQGGGFGGAPVHQERAAQTAHREAAQQMGGATPMEAVPYGGLRPKHGGTAPAAAPAAGSDKEARLKAKHGANYRPPDQRARRVRKSAEAQSLASGLRQAIVLDAIRKSGEYDPSQETVAETTAGSDAKPKCPKCGKRHDPDSPCPDDDGDGGDDSSDSGDADGDSDGGRMQKALGGTVRHRSVPALANWAAGDHGPGHALGAPMHYATTTHGRYEMSPVVQGGQVTGHKMEFASHRLPMGGKRTQLGVHPTAVAAHAAAVSHHQGLGSPMQKSHMGEGSPVFHAQFDPKRGPGMHLHTDSGAHHMTVYPTDLGKVHKEGDTYHASHEYGDVKFKVPSEHQAAFHAFVGHASRRPELRSVTTSGGSPVQKSAATILQEATQAAEALMKSGGEGSRGGHVIGHTRSGKAIYGAGHAKYQGIREKHKNGWGSVATSQHVQERFPEYTADDHWDAGIAHAKLRDRKNETDTHTIAAEAHAEASGDLDDAEKRKKKP